MDRCPRCNQESPAGSLHCVHCGYRLVEEAAHEKTQFGMPMVRPAPTGGSAGPQTTQFGAEDLARLAAAAKGETLEAPPKAVPSLLAGLPRPRVASAPSPLTEGLKKPVRPAAAPKPSARSTVLGMPLFGMVAGSTPAAPVEPEPTPTDDAGPAIMSLDSLDLGGGESAEPTLALGASADPTEPTGIDGTRDIILAMRAPSRATEPRHQPTELSKPATGVPRAGGNGAPTEPSPMPAAAGHGARAPAPASQPPRSSPAPRPGLLSSTADAPRPTPTAGMDTETDGAAGGAAGSRVLALAIGLTLLGLFAYPVTKMWFWQAIGALQGSQRVFLLGLGGSGLLALLCAVLPVRNGTRIACALVAGLAGVAFLFRL